MNDPIEDVAEEFARWLKDRGFAETEKLVAGLGSKRVLTRTGLLVLIRNDRGAYSVEVGRFPAGLDEDHRFSTTFWALCLGTLAVKEFRPAQEVEHFGDEDWMRQAQDVDGVARAVIERIEGLAAKELLTLETCVRQRYEAYWRARGWWPPPGTGTVLRPGTRDDRP